MPETPEFLPPIDQLPARPSTYEPRNEELPLAPEAPAPTRRRRRTQAEMLAGVQPHSPGSTEHGVPTGVRASDIHMPVTLPPGAAGENWHPESAEAVFGDGQVMPRSDNEHAPPRPQVEPPAQRSGSGAMMSAVPGEIQITQGPTVSVHLGTTANIGNFENIKYDIGLDGVPFDASDEDIEAIMNQSLATQQSMMDRMGAHLLARVAAVKQARGVID